MNSRILVIITGTFFTFLLRAQEKFTDLKHPDETFNINKSIKTEDRYWYNMRTAEETYLILTSDGEHQNTVLFNLDGLNIIPQLVLDAVKAGEYYYLIVSTESSYYIIRTTYHNRKWHSEAVSKLIYSWGEDFLRKINNRVFLIQKTQARILEIKGLALEEIYRKKESEPDQNLADFTITSDGSPLYFLYKTPYNSSTLTLLQIKSGENKEITIPNCILYSETWGSCTPGYQFAIDDNFMILYTGTRYLIINLDALTFKEPFEGKSLSNILVKDKSIYISVRNPELTATSSTITRLSFSGEKTTEINIPIRDFNRLLYIDSTSITGLNFLCFDSRIVTYNIKTNTYLIDWLGNTKDYVLVKNRVYFTGYQYGSAYFQDGEVYKGPSPYGNTGHIFSLRQDEKFFSLILQNNTVSLKDLSGEDSTTMTLSLKTLAEQAGLVNTNFSRSFSVLNESQGLHFSKPDYMLFTQTTKDILPVKYSSGSQVVHPSDQSLLNFKGRLYMVNQQGLFRLNNTLATPVIEPFKPNDYAPHFRAVVGQNYFLFAILNEKSELKTWVSDGTLQNTRQINLLNFVNSTIIGRYQQWLYYIKSDYWLYSFDGNEEKSLGTLGINNFRTYDTSTEEKTFYFFNRGDNGIEVTLLQTDNRLRQVFTMTEFKGNRYLSIAQVGEPNVFQIYDDRDKVSYLLRIDRQTNQYILTQLKDKSNVSYYPYVPNASPYINFQRMNFDWYDRDLRDVFTNTIFSLDEKSLFKPIFRFDSKQPNLERIEFTDKANETFVFLGGNQKIWRIDKKTQRASQFINEKDGLRYSRFINNDLYLNLCKDGECHLYKTNGTNAGTYRLTKKPLLVHEVYQFNNELYIHASDNINGSQTWKIRPEDARKVTDLFDEKEEPVPVADLPFILSSEPLANELINVYPNPFTEQLNLTTPVTGFQSLTLINATGMRLFETNAPQEKSIEALNAFLGNVQTGVYFLQINTGKTTLVKKIIKN